MALWGTVLASMYWNVGNAVVSYFHEMLKPANELVQLVKLIIQYSIGETLYRLLLYRYFVHYWLSLVLLAGSCLLKLYNVFFGRMHGFESKTFQKVCFCPLLRGQIFVKCAVSVFLGNQSHRTDIGFRRQTVTFIPSCGNLPISFALACLFFC
jgi:hypothetical protein